MPNKIPELEILLPVHNEGESIEGTLRELYDELSPAVSFRFVICEDGSHDDTQEILTALSAKMPMKLIMSKERKGYSRAVKDGMRALEAEYLLCIDSDGQCDPRDFLAFWRERESCDVVLGWRVKRADNRLRRWMSRLFYAVYQALYRVPVHDPSCPYVLVKRNVVSHLVDELGVMEQGFWWEFVARVHRRGYKIKEVPVHHRERAAGQTQVYKLGKLPGIGCKHLIALFEIWAQTRRGTNAHQHKMPPRETSGARG
jgi:dolichol-phosphate mannosyltransferase